jgi:hypothetical protein
MSTYEPPRYLKDQPLSAPVWMWIGYGLFCLGIAFLIDNGLGALFGVLFVVMFSFQFWSFATWRGSRRAYEESLSE